MIKTDITLPFNYSDDDIFDAISLRLPVTRDDILDMRILKRTLNLSDKSNIGYSLSVGISLSPEREGGLLKMKKKVSAVDDLSLTISPSAFPSRPLVVGAGPAGLFAALLLAEAGARPVLIERGLPVEERTALVDRFNRFGILDSECNIQFGEGGAGTFSDGKLKVGSMDKYKYKMLSEFVEAGAPDEIMFSVGAHVGTDKLQNIVKKVRQKIITLGGEVYFSTRLESLKLRDGRIVGAFAQQGDNVVEFDTDDIVLATGHSARDVFLMLRTCGAQMTAKGFGIGLRIEHPREYIDRLVYGDNPPRGIGAASYHLVTHLSNGRSVYSFCMCPGGTVVAAASEQGGIVTNGMSRFSRDDDNSNAAFLVSVTPDDFGNDPLAGIELQRKIEMRAFRVAGGDYTAPTTTMEAFVKGMPAIVGEVKPSYPRGVKPISAEEYLPDFITDSLKQGIFDFDDWMSGFYYPSAAMTGPETRTTSPIRVQRGTDYSAVGISGLYPTGEGAGYAGGIVSSARDGLLVAEAIINKYKK